MSQSNEPKVSPQQTAEMIKNLKNRLEVLQAEGYRTERAAQEARFNADKKHQEIYELEQTIAAMEAENAPQGG